MKYAVVATSTIVVSKGRKYEMSDEILKQTGVTEAERRLAEICQGSFLSLWSYPAVFRDQGQKGNANRDGKEVCDLLVVFGDNVLIFSTRTASSLILVG